jgi:hypothetical protein
MPTDSCGIQIYEINDIALETYAEGAAENGEWFEGRRSDAVVIKRYLIRSGQIESSEHAPDVGSPDLGCRVARSIRKENDAFAHGPLPPGAAHASALSYPIKQRGAGM